LAKLNGYLDIVEQVTPLTPSVGSVRLFSNNKKLYYRDSDGVVTLLGASTTTGVAPLIVTTVLTSTEINNKYYDLSNTPDSPETSVSLDIMQGLLQEYGVDYSVVNNGGGQPRRVTWDSADPNVSIGLVGELSVGDIIRVFYFLTS